MYTAIENIQNRFAQTNINDDTLQTYSNYAAQFLEFGKSLKSSPKVVTQRSVSRNAESGSIYFLMMVSYVGNAILSIVICATSYKERNNKLTPKQSVYFAIGLIVAESIFFGISVLIWRVPYVYPEYVST